MDELVEWMKANPGRFAYNTPGTGGAGDSFVRTSVYNFLPEEASTSDDAKWEEQWDAWLCIPAVPPPVHVSVRRFHCISQ